VQDNCNIVKRVSWFESSLLLRIQIKHTYKYKFLIKTKDSILIESINNREEEQAKHGLAWVDGDRLYLN
jgi:hypothetical protein